MASKMVEMPSQNEIETRSADYIKYLASKPENMTVDSSWYCIAACAFIASGQGHIVAQVYLVAISYHPNDVTARRIIIRRLKEALLKGAVMTGTPRMLNAYFPLMAAIPDEESWDHDVVRQEVSNPYSSEILDRGTTYMRRVFGDGDMDSFVDKLGAEFPDLKAMIVNTIYGLYQSEVSIIDAVTTSQINIASLIPMDVAAEVGWHMRGLINNGGTMDQLTDAYSISKEVTTICGVVLRKPLPAIEDVIGKERLIS